MNKIINIKGKLFLSPDNIEIPIDSVLGIKYCIREAEKILSHVEKEVEANEKAMEYFRQKAIHGNITANESLSVQNQILFKSRAKMYNLQKEISDLKFSLEIVEIRGQQKIENEENKSILPQPIKKDEIEFRNNFDTVNKEKVYLHFKCGLVESKMLTETELIEYLKTAFEKKVIPDTLFNIKSAISKDKVMKVFYEYYKDVAGKPYGKQKDYAGLLGNYFQGYKTSTVSTNFSKTIY